MLTNNYYKFLQAIMLMGKCKTSTNITAVDYGGNARTLFFPSTKTSYLYYNAHYAISFSGCGDGDQIFGYIGTPSSGHGWGVHFGTGTTAPTLDDYTLESMITSGLTIASQTGSRTITDNKVTITGIYLLSNSGDADVVVGEIGYYGMAYYSASNWTCFLLDRTVLDEPITIPAGSTGQVAYTIEVTLPTAPTE